MIHALLSYVMQYAHLPRFVYHVVNKMRRYFFWRESKHVYKVHLISRENFCYPKTFDGLGLRKTMDINPTCMIKVGLIISYGENSRSLDKRIICKKMYKIIISFKIIYSYPYRYSSLISRYPRRSLNLIWSRPERWVTSESACARRFLI